MQKNILSSLSFQGGAIAATLGYAGWGAPVAALLSAVGVPIEADQIAELIDASTVIFGILASVIGTMRRPDIRVL